MAHGMVVDVLNLSDCCFRLDGEVLTSGEWRTDPTTPIAPRTKTRIRLAATGTSGVRGVLWWTDDETHSKYVSMALSNPRFLLGTAGATFACFAGLPPANLKDELAHALSLARDVEVAPEGACCSWATVDLGPTAVVEVCIYDLLPSYMPLECGGANANLSAGTGEPGALPQQAEDAARVAQAHLLGEQHEGGSASEAPSTALSATWRAQTRPKDLQDGLKRGLQTAGGLLAASVVTPIATTVRGAREGGVWGFVKGLGLGLLSGCALAVGGTAAGVVQVGRGIKHTPHAIASRREEKVWDQETGQWLDIDLPSLEAELEAESPSEEDSPCHGGAAGVVDTEYYDLLKVHPGAKASDIRRAYHREARKCHPDRNPGDAMATQNFQQLAKAYQVLSDAELRRRYDSHGPHGLEGSIPQMDPTLFFSLLFGSERFAEYTGELHLAMQIDRISKGFRSAPEELDAQGHQPQADAATIRRRQHRREVRCAVFLRKRLEPWAIHRDEARFVTEAQAEAAELARVRFGPELLVALGEIYQIRADIYLANELAGRCSFAKRAVAARRSCHTVGSQLRFCRSAIGSAVAAKRVTDAARRQEQLQQGAALPEASGLEDAVDDALPQFLQTAWAAVVRDIDCTIKHVGRKLLQDKSVPWQIRIRRAQALKVLGETFAASGAAAGAIHGHAGTRGLTSEAAKELVLEAVLGSIRERQH